MWCFVTVALEITQNTMEKSDIKYNFTTNYILTTGTLEKAETWRLRHYLQRLRGRELGSSKELVEGRAPGLREARCGPSPSHHAIFQATAQDSVASEGRASLEVGIEAECQGKHPGVTSTWEQGADLHGVCDDRAAVSLRAKSQEVDVSFSRRYVGQIMRAVKPWNAESGAL